jgi:hypothetical protein
MQLGSDVLRRNRLEKITAPRMTHFIWENVRFGSRLCENYFFDAETKY